MLDRYVEAEPAWAKQLEGEMTLGRKRIVFRCSVVNQPRFVDLYLVLTILDKEISATD